MKKRILKDENLIEELEKNFNIDLQREAGLVTLPIWQLYRLCAQNYNYKLGIGFYVLLCGVLLIGFWALVYLR